MSMIHIASNLTNSTASSLQQADIQPNAIDLRLKKVFRIDGNDVFSIDEEHKKHRGTVEVQPSEDGFIYLEPGHYEVVMENEVIIGEGEAGWVITRSTLNRNGVFITSGLYDSAFRGPVAGVMHVNVGPMKVKPGTRVAQFLLFKAEMLHHYNGDYGYDLTGKPKEMENRLYGEGGRKQ
jgi:deoxycytidine triphosphate deaminase